VRPLIELLLHASDIRTREIAAYQLTWFEDPRAVQALLRVAENRLEAAALRGQALEAVGAIQAHRGRRALARVIPLLDDLEVQVRFWACYALAQFHDLRALPHLHRLLSDEAVCPGWWSVKGEAAWAIATLEDGPGADAIWQANSQDRSFRP